MAVTAAAAHPAERRSHSFGILTGLALGIALGLFIGDRAAVLQDLADAYIKLLQMTVLPYVTGSLIAGLGSLRWEDVRALGLRVGSILLLFWLIALAGVFLFPLALPAHETASFFTTALLEPRASFDLVNLYIPANPFNSLANAVVPAVVLFSTILGISLITVPNRSRLLEVLKVVNATLSKATAFVVALTPFGLFVIAAVAAGTLTLEDLTRLELYLASYAAASLLLSLWVLPGLVAALTPIPYRAVLSRTYEALVTGFMTANLFAVLPMLIDEVKTLLQEHGRLDEEGEVLPAVIVSAAFNFPHVGKILSLSFILFAAWFSGVSLPAVDYPKLAGLGIAVMFGNVNVAVLFLLDVFRIPTDTFQLFVATSVVNARFGTLMAAVHTVAIALLGTCAATGVLKIDRAKLIRFSVVTILLTAATVGGLRLLFTFAADESYDKDKVLTGMQMLRNRGDRRVFTVEDTVPPLSVPAGSVLDRVRARGILRVGYLDDSVPYAFFNTQRELVGFDVEMAHQLASDLGVKLEFAPLKHSLFEEGLDPNSCDLVMSGTAVTADRTLHVLFSTPYLDETLAFLVLDHRRSDFLEWDQVREMADLRVGVPRAPYFLKKIESELPNATIVPIDRIGDVFAPHDPPIDAFLLTAERGSAYTLLHPEFSVAVPQPRPAKVPLAYVLAGRDQALANVVNSWIELKRKDGTIDELFSYWILGQNATARKPRWSILRDLLHWGS